METMPRKRRLAERWRDLRPTKTAMFWSWVVVVVLTLVVGFEWGGWVTGKTARSMAEAAGHDAVVARLAPMCVTQAIHDPQWTEKRKALKTTESWDRTDYVVKQGWATLPAEQQADPRVAEQCVTLLLQRS
jgi:hypothetical protein